MQVLLKRVRPVEQLRHDESELQFTQGSMQEVHL